jgi:hypothetical protein
LFEQYVNLETGDIHHEQFSIDIASLRNMKKITEPVYEIHEVIEDTANATEHPSPLTQLLLNYKLPLVMEDFVEHFITENIIDYDKLEFGVYLLDHKEMIASGKDEDLHRNYHRYVESSRFTNYVEITLAIPEGAINTQITQTISANKNFIKDRQKAGGGVNRKRVRPYTTAERDNIIYKLSQTMKPKDLQHELSNKHDIHVSSVDISNILYRMKSTNRS